MVYLQAEGEVSVAADWPPPLILSSRIVSSNPVHLLSYLANKLSTLRSTTIITGGYLKKSFSPSLHLYTNNALQQVYDQVPTYHHVYFFRMFSCLGEMLMLKQWHTISHFSRLHDNKYCFRLLESTRNRFVQLICDKYCRILNVILSNLRYKSYNLAMRSSLSLRLRAIRSDISSSPPVAAAALSK